LIVLFVAGMVLSFYLHDRKIIKSSEY
jgi:hypothetical protein